MTIIFNLNVNCNSKTLHILQKRTLNWNKSSKNKKVRIFLLATIQVDNSVKAIISGLYLQTMSSNIKISK